VRRVSVVVVVALPYPAHGLSCEPFAYAVEDLTCSAPLRITDLGDTTWKYRDDSFQVVTHSATSVNTTPRFSNAAACAWWAAQHVGGNGCVDDIQPRLAPCIAHGFPQMAHVQ
jgi:hypothetical protein